MLRIATKPLINRQRYTAEPSVPPDDLVDINQVMQQDDEFRSRLWPDDITPYGSDSDSNSETVDNISPYNQPKFDPTSPKGQIQQQLEKINDTVIDLQGQISWLSRSLYSLPDVPAQQPSNHFSLDPSQPLRRISVQ